MLAGSVAALAGGASARRLAALNVGDRRAPGVPPWARLVTRASGRGAEECAAGIVELCDGLAAELTAGRTPEEALAAAVGALPPPLRETLAAVPAAAEIPEALRSLSGRPGAGGLRLLAACWIVGVDRGAAFAPVVDGLAAALRAERAHRAAVRAQLAGARTTARLLAVLPALGLAMSYSLGSDPLSFLLTTLPGLACLLVALTLDALGLRWTSAIATSAERS